MSSEAPAAAESTAARVARFAEIGAAALLWTALVVGASVIALTLPVYTSLAGQALDVPHTAGLPAADVVRLSGQVRALVADDDFEPLPAEWRGAPAFDAAAVSHLMDVRAVIGGARLATGIAALLLASYVAFCVALARIDVLRVGMRAAAALCGVFVVLAAIAAVTDFSWLFARFHGLFFRGGTWTFPSDSLLIRLFPQRFWIASGAAWAALVLTGSGALLLASRLSRTAQARLFASRTANNV